MVGIAAAHEDGGLAAGAAGLHDRQARYFAQHVGPGSNRELTDFVTEAQPIPDTRSAAKAVADAAGHGLDVVDLREESLRVEFHDIGAVVYFLRKVIWTVPDFTVERYRDRLAALPSAVTIICGGECTSADGGFSRSLPTSEETTADHAEQQSSHGRDRSVLGSWFRS